jgi:diaminopimelate epimerase
MTIGERTPLRVGNHYFRAHGLGNDYLVFEAAEAGGGWLVGDSSIPALCHRGEGVGSDGIVVLLDRTPGDGVFPLRMFNPDGSEFERSGNGLRVLAAYLFREGLVGERAFRVRSGGDEIGMTVHGVDGGGRFDISVEMGRAQAGSSAIPLDVSLLDAQGRVLHPVAGALDFLPVSVGNPHAVLFPSEPGDDLLAVVGPFLSRHPAFSEGTNVQLVRVLAPDRVRIWIWERGVGRTSASGTSSCAAAVASIYSGRIPPGQVTVEMDGGRMAVTVSPGLDVVLRGPVGEVSRGVLASGFVERLKELESRS